MESEQVYEFYDLDPDEPIPDDEDYCERCGMPATHTGYWTDSTPTDRGDEVRSFSGPLCDCCDPPYCSHCRRPSQFCICP
jgi:hypothetical protein